MNIISLFNNKLSEVKSLINILYDESKTQYLKELNKSFTSYMELTNINIKRDDTADDFQDMQRVLIEDNTLLDRDGYNLGYRINEVKFLTENYTKSVYPMIMPNGNIIPGSVFRSVFKDGIGFWGYQASEKTTSYFSIDLEEISEINKIYIYTNNKLDVECFIKEDHDKDWVSLGTRYDRKHVWNIKPQTTVSIKFQAYTDVFSVSRIQVGRAYYQKEGYILSDYYSIEDMYRVKLTVDDDIPSNTDINYFISVSGQPDSYPIETEEIISGGVLFHKASGVPPIVVPSGVIEESLYVRSGYREWEEIETYDWAWVVENENPDVSGDIIFGTDYRIINGSLQKVFIGDTVFIEGTDFTTTYDVDNNTVSLTLLSNTDIPSGSLTSLECSLLVREKVSVNQYRTYVDLTQDESIYIQGFDIPFRIRHVVIKEEIIRDTTVLVDTSNASTLLTNVNGTSTYVISGQIGTNLIEIELLDINGDTYVNPINTLTIPNVNYFAKRHELLLTRDTPDITEFNLIPDVSSGSLEYKITPAASGVVYTEYAESTNIPLNIQLKAVLNSSDGDNTPTIRSYRLDNYTY